MLDVAWKALRLVVAYAKKEAACHCRRNGQDCVDEPGHTWLPLLNPKP